MVRYGVLGLFVAALVLFASRCSYAQDVWQPYVELEGRAGSLPELLQGSMFVPVWQNGRSLMFADIRGQWSDVQSAEGNFGLAYREITPSNWIVGVYGFYDVKHSANNNNFQQATFGAEYLNALWGFRANGYIPTRDVGLVPELNVAELRGNNIVVRRGEERAYYGMDAEAESLMWCGVWSDPCCPQGDCGQPGCTSGRASLPDLELWGSLGVFHFDNDTPGFDNMTGPRARIELRLYDLAMLGNDSRLVLAGQYEYDDVRGSVGTAMVAVRIPLCAGNRCGPRLSRMGRRMVTPIVRDIDIVSNAAVSTNAEPARYVETGELVGPVTVVDANTADVPAAVNAAGNNSTVIVDGTQGTIDVGSPVITQLGQTLRGAGFQVSGAETGAVATFGQRPTLNGTSVLQNVIQIGDDNGTIRDMDISGGMHGVHAANVSDFTIFNSGISGSAANGINITGNSGSLNYTILENSIAGVAGDAIFVNSTGSSIMSGDIRNNVLNGIGGNGLDITADGDDGNLVIIGGNFIDSVVGTGIQFDSDEETTIGSISLNNIVTNAGTTFNFDNVGDLSGTILINGVPRP